MKRKQKLQTMTEIVLGAVISAFACLKERDIDYSCINAIHYSKYREPEFDPIARCEHIHEGPFTDFEFDDTVSMEFYSRWPKLIRYKHAACHILLSEESIWLEAKGIDAFGHFAWNAMVFKTFNSVASSQTMVNSVTYNGTDKMMNLRALFDSSIVNSIYAIVLWCGEHGTVVFGQLSS